MSVKEKMTALADEIRAKTGKEEALSLDAMAENIGEVYTAGAKTEYDAFWDNYQENGKRADYGFAFAGYGWTDELFKPKYNLGITANTVQMFYGCKITDLSALLEKQGVTLDTRNYAPTSYNYIETFRNGYNLTRVPVLHVPKQLNMHYTYFYCRDLHTIDGLVLSEEGNQTFDISTFSNCSSLKNITITGKIGNNFDIHWSPLSKESILSIFTALSDNSLEKTVAFSLSAVKKAFETVEGARDGSTSDEWNNLLQTKLNWTVVLV